MKFITIAVFIIFCFSAFSASLAINIKTNPHHGESRKLSLKISAKKNKQELIINDVKMPEARILSIRKDLETITTFKPIEKSCNRDTFSYERIKKGNAEKFKGCRHSEEARQLFSAFERISPLR